MTRLKWATNFMVEDFEPEIVEVVTKQKESVKIKGTLLRATESRNGRVYEFDAVIKAGKEAVLPMPISMNHTDNVDDNVAKITKLVPTDEGLDYEGIAYNTAKFPDMIEKLKNGLISKISIEGDGTKLDNKGDKVIVKEMRLLGAGFVKYEGIPGACASVAEALEKEMNEEVEDMELEEKLQKSEEALREAMEKIKTLEASVDASKNEKLKTLEESITALQSDIKTLKETKPSGNITNTDGTPEYKVVESLNGATVEKTFVFEHKKSANSASFYAMNPSEFY